MSYLQIYCEALTDLLDPRPVSLSIRESRRNGVFVENLSEITINSYSDVKEALERGSNARVTAATNANATSSRSHAAILIKVTTPDAVASGPMEHSQQSVREGTLVLVDLAGSERFPPPSSLSPLSLSCSEPLRPLGRIICVPRRARASTSLFPHSGIASLP
jgi:kinesin family member 5